MNGILDIQVWHDGVSSVFEGIACARVLNVCDA